MFDVRRHVVTGTLMTEKWGAEVFFCHPSFCLSSFLVQRWMFRFPASPIVITLPIIILLLACIERRSGKQNNGGQNDVAHRISHPVSRISHPASHIPHPDPPHKRHATTPLEGIFTLSRITEPHNPQ
jgi:hypothetical protein